jgi:hypothetical protein
MKKISVHILFFCGALAGFSASVTASQIRIATFDVDATPPVGSELAYDPVRKHGEISLRCRGLAILGSGKPIV